MTLSASEKKRLRGRGQRMDDDASLGRGGLSDGSLRHVRDLLERKELVKVRFIEAEGAERQAVAAELAAAVDAQLVAVVGRTALLYRANESLDPDKRALGA